MVNMDYGMYCEPLDSVIESEASREAWFHRKHFLSKAGSGNLDMSELDCEKRVAVSENH